VDYPHPILRKYEHLPVRSRGRFLPPFYAVSVSSLLGGVVVFPDPDFAGGNNEALDRVLVHDSFPALCGGRVGGLPSFAMLPVPPDHLRVPGVDSDTEEEGSGSDSSAVAYEEEIC